MPKTACSVPSYGRVHVGVLYSGEGAALVVWWVRGGASGASGAAGWTSRENEFRGASCLPIDLHLPIPLVAQFKPREAHVKARLPDNPPVGFTTILHRSRDLRLTRPVEKFTLPYLTSLDKGVDNE